MKTEQKLSLFSAILVNLNIMIGTGIFINTTLLAQTAGALSPFIYVLVGIIILPLIYAFYRLLNYYPGGTLYEFGTIIHTSIGFLSSWGYFTGKLAAAMLNIHIFVLLMQCIFPTLTALPTLITDIGILALFAYLNTLNLKTGSMIQTFFLIFKSIPILFTFFTALFLCKLSSFSSGWVPLHMIIGSFPFALFAFAGFEASIALNKVLINPKKNGPRALLISYLIIVLTFFLYQSSFFSILGDQLKQIEGLQFIFQILTAHFIPTHLTMQAVFNVLLLSCIATSALGSSYSIMYSNVWNLYTLAQFKHLLGSRFIIFKNKQQAPVICVLMASGIMLTYLLFTWGNQVSLQQISALAAIIAYGISACAFALVTWRQKRQRIMGLLGIISSIILAIGAFHNARIFGFQGYTIYFVLLIIGIVQYFITGASGSSKLPNKA